MKLFVYHTPELTPIGHLPDCAIAVDVLRATSTIATALNAGAEAVQVFSDMDKLMKISEEWPAEKRLRAGERGGAKVAGCDLGNSPLDCTPQLMGGRRLFISTTNGTRALQRVQDSPIVLAGAFINRQAIVNHIVAKQPETIGIVGSGWEGSFSLEDTACAGAITDGLLTATGLSIGELAGNDEMIAAYTLFKQWEKDLLQLMHHASHGQRLLRLNCHEDLKYCVDIDTINVVPVQREPGVLVKQ